MAANRDDEDLLYRLACECEGLFDQLREALATTGPEVAIVYLCTEFQQRFAIWAAHLGVFARKSQCLDTRLRNLPDIQDLVVRLLDILRRSLQQCKVEATGQREADPVPTGSYEPRLRADILRPRSSQIQAASMRAIDDTLTRLNRLGVTIRQSSSGKVDSRASKFAAGLDLKPFADLCANAVQALYPNAHQSLKSHLSKSMTDRYARMQFLNSRHKKLEMRREPRMQPPSIVAIPKKADIPIAQPARASFIPVPTNLLKPPTALSQSDLSTVNIQQIRSRLRSTGEASTKFRKTSSIQVKQGNYPQPPATNGNSSYFTCDWCFELLSRETLSKSEWRRHIDRDLKPYVCLSEECPEAHPAYPTFDEWDRHMGLHSRRWHQRFYLTSSWVCAVCEFNPDVYINSQSLHAHLKESHHSDFTAAQLQTISQQSKTEQPRAWNDCLLCCFAVEEEKDNDVMFPKRRKGQPKRDSAKSARKALDMTNPDPHSSDSELADKSSGSEGAGSHQQSPLQKKHASRAISRHIAMHLQGLMSLTLRFAASQNSDGGLDDDIKSDSVDIDEGNNSSGGNDVGRLSDIASDADIKMEDADEAGNAENAMDLDDGLVEDDMPVPDTDLDLEDIPRQYDGLSAENDTFLKKVIDSGAYQSWQDKPEMAAPLSLWSCVQDALRDQGPQLRELLEAKEKHGRQTPLSWAAEGGYEHVVNLLLEKGADLEAKDKDGGWTPLIAASSNRQEAVVKLLLENGADVNATSNSGLTPLHSASRNGYGTITKLLLDNGADVTVRNNDGWTPLNVASYSGYEAVVKLLLEKGADVTVANNDGWTPLNVASNNGHEAVVRLLLKNGADVTVGDESGRTPLHSASRNGYEAITKLLLDNGADVTVRNNDGWTPLDLASQNGRDGVFKLLLEKGADVTDASNDERLNWRMSNFYHGQTSMETADQYHGSRTSAESEKELHRLVQRQNAIKDLIDTEAVFSRDMDIVKEIYKGTAEACPALDDTKINLLFRNIDEMTEFHNSFLLQLGEAISSVYVRNQRRTIMQGEDDASNVLESFQGASADPSDAKDRATSLGSAFQANISNLKLVHEGFVRNSDRAAKLLTQIQRDETVKAWLNECNNETKYLTATRDLNSLLNKPMQRIAQYPELITIIIQHTPQDHPDMDALVAVKYALQTAITKINKTKKNFELVRQIVSRKRAQSDDKGGFTSAFGKRASKLPASNSQVPEDVEYAKLNEKFGDDYLRLQVVVRDVEFYTRQVSAYVHEFLQYISSIELVMRMQPSSYPELESKWASFGVLVRDLEKVHLEEHLAQVRKQVIEPFERVISTYENPSLAIRERQKRRLDYERAEQLKQGGKKVDRKLKELAEQYEALNDMLKKELPMLSSLAKRVGQICLGNLVNIQANWYRAWIEKMRTVLGDYSEVPSLDEVVSTFQRDFAYGRDPVMRIMANLNEESTLLMPDFDSRRSTSSTIPSDIDKGGTGLGTVGARPSPHRYYYGDYYPGTQVQQGPFASPGPPKIAGSSSSADQPMQSSESANAPRRDSATIYNSSHGLHEGRRYANIFSSAMPISDDPKASQPLSSASTREPTQASEEYNILWLAASLFEFNIVATKHEAGYPYLTYQAGEIFDVMGEKGELWLAKNQDDPLEVVGWIWSKHFAKLADS